MVSWAPSQSTPMPLSMSRTRCRSPWAPASQLLQVGTAHALPCAPSLGFSIRWSPVCIIGSTRASPTTCYTLPWSPKRWRLPFEQPSRASSMPTSCRVLSSYTTSSTRWFSGPSSSMTTTSTWRSSPALYVMLAHHLQAPASAQPPAQAQHWVFYNYKHHDGQGDSALLYHTLEHALPKGSTTHQWFEDRLLVHPSCRQLLWWLLLACSRCTACILRWWRHRQW